MRHSSFVILILFATLLPAGARAYDDETLRGLCEVGDHVESASACRTLAKRAAGTPAERSLRAAWARLELRRCRGAACGEPLEELWRHSDRPVELSGVAARAQSACAAGDERACSLAAAAAWMGLGASLDPVGAMNLAAKGKGGSPARWEALAPAGFRRDPLPTARTLAAAGEHAGVLLVLDDAMRRGLLSGAGLGQARTQWAVSSARRWDELVEPLRRSGHFLEAAALGELLVAPLPSSGPEHLRLKALREEGARHHLVVAGLAAQRGASLSAQLHRTFAAKLGSGERLSNDAHASYLAGLPHHPQLVAPAGCEWMQAQLDARFPRTRATVGATIEATCTESQRSWTETQPYKYTVTEYETKTVTVSGGTRQESRQVLDPCGTRALDGRCMSAWRTETRTVQQPSRTETQRVPKQVTRSGTRTVERRALQLGVKGTVRLGDGTPTSIGFHQQVDETAFHDAHGSQRFSSASLSGWKQQAVQQLVSQVEGVQARLRAEEARRLLALAASEADPLLVEEHRLRAIALGARDVSALPEGLDAATTARLLVDPSTAVKLPVALPLPGGFKPVTGALAIDTTTPLVTSRDTWPDLALPRWVRGSMVSGALVYRREHEWESGGGLVARFERPARMERLFDYALPYGGQLGFETVGGAFGSLHGGLALGVHAGPVRAAAVGGLTALVLGGWDSDDGGFATQFRVSGMFGFDLGVDVGPVVLSGAYRQIPSTPLEREKNYTAGVRWRRAGGGELGLEFQVRTFRTDAVMVAVGAAYRVSDRY